MSHEQKTLLQRLSSISFVLVELALFLDTHPENKEALKMFKEYTEKYKPILKAYETQYGPIKQSAAIGCTSWDWAKDNWPWDNCKEKV